MFHVKIAAWVAFYRSMYLMRYLRTDFCAPVGYGIGDRAPFRTPDHWPWFQVCCILSSPLNNGSRVCRVS